MTEHRKQNESLHDAINGGNGDAASHSVYTRAHECKARVQGAFRTSKSKGFTLIELMVVMAIMGVLIAIAQPSLKQSIIKAREAVLKEDLFQMREAIDQYYADNGKYPDQLPDLINAQDRSKSYLRGLPKDPFTGSADWITVAPAEGEEGGVFDVHSASPLLAVDGTAYNIW